MKYWLFLIVTISFNCFGQDSIQDINVKEIVFHSAVMEATIPSKSKISIQESPKSIDRFDIISFHHPHFDTLIKSKMYAYYGFDFELRRIGRDELNKNFNALFVPLKERPIWVGRCVGIPGDSIEMKSSNLFINKKLFHNKTIRKTHSVYLPMGKKLSSRILKEVGISSTYIYNQNNPYQIPISENELDKLKSVTEIDSAIVQIIVQGVNDEMVFPFNTLHNWNKDYWGVVEVPTKGRSVVINFDNIELYRRIIENYEGGNISVINDQVIINGLNADIYVFKMNYYLIVNDNRDYSYDSRHWGFLPENHITGKVVNGN